MLHTNATKNLGAPKEKSYHLIKTFYSKPYENLIILGPQEGRSEVGDLIQHSNRSGSATILIDIKDEPLTYWQERFSNIGTLKQDGDKLNWNDFLSPISDCTNLFYYNLEGGLHTLRNAQHIIKYSDIMMYMMPFHGIGSMLKKVFPNHIAYPLENYRNQLVFLERNQTFEPQEISLPRSNSHPCCPNKCRNSEGHSMSLRYRKTMKSWICDKCGLILTDEEFETKGFKSSRIDIVSQVKLIEG
jgi:hypothetical protein